MAGNGVHTEEARSNVTLANAYKGGVFDLVPRLGYREYWHPGILVADVGRKPVSLKMLGDDIVFFRDEHGGVAALTDYCPHRGARLSGGWRVTPGGGAAPGKMNNEFKGFITCPYHGFTYNSTGQCVAALTDGPESRLQPVLRARHYPTQVHRGVVWVWMGETEPVPLEEDVPDYFWDDDVIDKINIRVWPMNWTLTVENSQDSHEGKVHRGSLRRVWSLGLFRKQGAFWGGARVVEEGKNYVYVVPIGAGQTAASRTPQAFYPVLGKVWPRHIWWRRLGRGAGQRTTRFDPDRKGGILRLPAMASPGIPATNVHLRWAVPVDEDSCRMWTFTLTRQSFRTGPFGLSRFLGRMWWRFMYNTWYIYGFIQGVNELEDMPIQSIGTLDPNKQQTMGPSDAANAFWRRRMPFKSRDYERVWSVQEAKAGELAAKEDLQLEDVQPATPAPAVSRS